MGEITGTTVLIAVDESNNAFNRLINYI